MKSLYACLFCLASAAVTGCGGNRTCDEPQFYEAAKPGERIVVPDGLDDLPANRELKIPEPSERPPRPPGSGCVDEPPTMSTDSA